MMTNSQLATASLDDIVFDGRNRHYGAYELRALYQRHMTRALIIATVMFALILVFPAVASLLKDKAVPVPSHPTIIEVMPPPLDAKKIEPPVAAPARPATPPPVQQHIATTRFTELKPVPDEQVTEDVPEQDKLANSTVAAVTQAGTNDPAALPIEPIETSGKGDGVVADKPYYSVEQMPELPGGGGQLAIVAAIQKAVRYPSNALRNGVEGKVFVSFVVDPKGEVTDVKIVKGLGSGLDEETIRAIKTLPRFIPGKQNGREVSVAFTVPITYKIQ
jgi:protein TonB